MIYKNMAKYFTLIAVGSLGFISFSQAGMQKAVLY